MATNKEYTDRLNKINNTNKTILESIDRPIRPLVIELNRIGLKTKFSCCGFPYDNEDEEEPKSHTLNQAYVHFFTPTDEIGIQNFFLLSTFAIENCWRLNAINHSCWHLFCNNPIANLYEKNDKIEMAAHDYEFMVIAIHLLTKQLKSLPSTSDKIIIEDGNKKYTDIVEWQIKPKKDYTEILK